MSLNRHQKRRIGQWVVVSAVIAIMVSMAAINMTHPIEVDPAAAAFSERLLSGDMDNATEDEREAMRDQWAQLPPELRRQVFQEVARTRLAEMREKNEGLTAEQRTERITTAVKKMREESAKITPEQRAAARERLNSTEAQEMIAGVLDFYHSELTARERAEYDPLIHEWLLQIERMAGQ